MGFEKPHPEIFRHVLNDLRIGPDDIVHVGDDDAVGDGEGAARAGIPAILIQRPARPLVSSSNHAPTIQTLDELL